MRNCCRGSARAFRRHGDDRLRPRGLGYLERNHIGFASAPGSNANSAAEYVIAALLEVGRKHSIRLEGKSIGVIGVGNVGSRVARKCEALGMHVLRNDPPLQRQTGDPQVRAPRGAV